jgi:hypothetical protein
MFSMVTRIASSLSFDSLETQRSPVSDRRSNAGTVRPDITSTRLIAPMPRKAGSIPRLQGGP